jgi:hypothetical protein
MIRTRDVLWKVRDPVAGDASAAAYTSLPTTAVWGELTIGDTYSNFTGLHAFNDTPVAGKTTGLWVFSREDAQFFDIAPEFENYPSTFHWSRGLGWRGWLITNADPQALWRYDGLNFQEIGFLLEAPQFDDMSARVQAIANNSQRLFTLSHSVIAALVENDQSWLCSTQEVRIGQSMHWIIHTEHLLKLAHTAHAMFFFGNTLYVGGNISRVNETVSMACGYRLTQPTLGTPSHVSAGDLRFTGTFVTPWWDGGYPDSNKALRTLLLRVQGMDATHTVKVEIQIDEDAAASWTNLQTFNSDGVKTISIETQANTKKAAKRCRLRFTLAAGSSATAPRAYPTTSPLVKLPFILHTSLLPTRQHSLELKVLVADNLPTLAGMELQTAAQLNTIMKGYITNATFPITITEDLDGDGAINTYRVVLNDDPQVETFESPERGRVTVYNLTAVEVPV